METPEGQATGRQLPCSKNRSWVHRGLLVSQSGPRGGSRRLLPLDSKAKEMGFAPGRSDEAQGNLGDAVHGVGGTEEHPCRRRTDKGEDAEADGLKCPRCDGAAQSVIYMGFPMHLCSRRECNTLWGFWSIIPCFWFNGWFVAYDGRYWKALLVWVWGNDE